jgi:hypothetical protein
MDPLSFSRTHSLKRAEKNVCRTSHHHVNVVANKMPAEAGKEEKKNAPHGGTCCTRVSRPRKKASAYFAHRRSIMQIINDADAYVTIDGDPGGYAGAHPKEWLSVFLADRSTIDACGTAPARQRVMPWVWCGWGTAKVWGGNPNNAPAQIAPYVRASLEVLKQGLPEPWSILHGRSSRDNWANGRVNIELTDALGLMPRATIFCYEAVEFEPAIPGSVLQFAEIRQILRQESRYAGTAAGVFGNAQQPVMVLPNLFFFAQGAKDLAYLDKSDDLVLADLADLLGGPRELLMQAWKCLVLPPESLPADLASRLRVTKLTGEAASCIPGGAQRYVEILAAEVESRRGYLSAIAARATSDEDAANRLATAAQALIGWWNVHRYVNDGDRDTGFSWRFVRGQDVAALRSWVAENAANREAVLAAAARQLVASGTLSDTAAPQVLKDL